MYTEERDKEKGTKRDREKDRERERDKEANTLTAVPIQMDLCYVYTIINIHKIWIEGRIWPGG